MNMESGIRPVRRIVTGHNAKGRSVIVSDAPSPHSMALAGVSDFGVTDIWKTDRAPANNDGREDACSGAIKLAPPANGTVFRVVQFPPDKDYVGKWKPDAAFASMGDSGAEAIHENATRHEAMHTTNSVDYAFVLEGEIWAVLDDDEVLMKAGDVLVQRGTSHAWSNRSDRPSMVGFVLIDANPVTQPKPQ
ncbi:cupin domain-containing protein [Polaromonas sp.]|uniref:cupin domain-containing protein n=1 Tax=Polaromonas sp. TaxID=1869339 RepID=UPI003BA94C89